MKNQGQASTSVLVVDGSNASRKLVANKLKLVRPEIDVDTHATASSAMPKLRERSYDLVAVGYTLPDGNGLDLADKIRDQGKNKQTPIVMVSSNPNIEDTDIRHAHGINAYFDKSNGIDALIEYLESFLPDPSSPPPRILYIDDSQTVIKVMSRNFEKQNIPVTTIESGMEAMQLLKGLDKQLGIEFDVVVTDMNLEGEISGIDLVRFIRQECGLDRHSLPILLASGSDDNELNYADLRKLGVNDFISKPVNQELLMARIEPWLQIKRSLESIL